MRVEPLTARVWGIVIACLVAFDATQLAIRIGMRSHVLTSDLPVMPIFRSIGASPPVLVGLVALSWIGSAGVAHGRWPIPFGLLALAANRVLLEAFGAFDGVYEEGFVHSGAALFGLVLGTTIGRILSPGDDDRAREHGALGAVGAFAATYVNAGTSKLHDSGFGWADAVTIRLMVAAHLPAGATTWTDAVRHLVLDHPTIPLVLSYATLVIQCGAVIMPWTWRTRLLWGTLALGFHLGIHLVSGILFLEAQALDITFAIPWTRVAARFGRGTQGGAAADGDTPSPALLRRTIATGVGVAVILGALLLGPNVRRDHPIERFTDAAHGDTGPSLRTLGPVSVGDGLADGWTIRAIHRIDERALVEVSRGDASVTFEVTALPTAPRGPFDGPALHVLYRRANAPFASFAPAMQSLAARLDVAAGEVEPERRFEAWLRPPL